jgi:hypothetical protein
MRYPPRPEWKRFFNRLPRWILGLILVLLFGRFVILAVWHWLFS